MIPALFIEVCILPRMHFFPMLILFAYWFLYIYFFFIITIIIIITNYVSLSIHLYLNIRSTNHNMYCQYVILHQKLYKLMGSVLKGHCVHSVKKKMFFGLLVCFNQYLSCDFLPNNFLQSHCQNVVLHSVTLCKLDLLRATSLA